MSRTSHDAGEIGELRARVAALEAMVASLAQARPENSKSDVEDAAAGLTALRPSRRSWLGLLAGIGAGSMFASTAHGETPEAGAAPLGPWKEYTPKLTGTKEDPYLGDEHPPEHWASAGKNGHYWQCGRTVLVKTWVQFGPGAKPGVGDYHLSLPVPALLSSDAWLGPTGVAVLHSAATKINRMAMVLLPSPDFVVIHLDNQAKIVGHDNPWVWAKSDGFNTFLMYEAAEPKG